jgi:hypothetical protein
MLYKFGSYLTALGAGCGDYFGSCLRKTEVSAFELCALDLVPQLRNSKYNWPMCARIFSQFCDWQEKLYFRVWSSGSILCAW